MGVEQLEYPSKELQEGNAKELKADRYNLIIPEMSQEYLEGLPRVDACKCLEDLVDEVDVRPDGHFEGKAVGECDVLPYGFKNVSVLH